jgi:hypothetical protein
MERGSFLITLSISWLASILREMERFMATTPSDPMILLAMEFKDQDRNS